MSTLAAQVPSLLARLGHPELLALGEPNHAEPAFPALRNDLLAVLVEHGFRSIAVESDRVRGLVADAWVRGGAGSLDDVLAEGFSHGFGAHPANRALLTWMRAWNEQRPPTDHLAFHGIDAPLEYGPPPSPRPYLEHLHAYLADHLEPDALLHRGERITDLLGEDARWSDPDAFHDAACSIGASPDAVALRAVADDLLTALHAHTPGLVAASSPNGWYRADVHGRAALGLLRYHAQAAQPDPPAVRISRLLGVRDALIAENLLAVHAHEHGRGSTLVFAHNGHLQRHPTTWHQPDMDLQWWGAGAILAPRLRYAFVAGSLGASAALGLPTPATGTFEAALPVVDGELVDPRPFRDAALVRRTDVTPEQGHFPLDATTLADADALLHVTSAPAGLSADELARRITALPGVTCLVADEAGSAPEVSWGDRFFHVGDDRRRPFATIVEHDVPGFDEASRLDRPDVFRLNVELGRRAFEREFDFAPADLPEHLAELDAARLDTIIPHPAYGTYGWASILNPTPARLPEVDRLLTHALTRRRRTPAD